MKKKDVYKSDVVESGLTAGVVIRGEKRVREAEEREIKEYVSKKFSPFTGLTPNIITYNSLLNVSARHLVCILLMNAMYTVCLSFLKEMKCDGVSPLPVCCF